MIVLGLDHRGEQFAAQFRRDRPAGQVLFAADQFVGLFEDGRRAVIDQPIERLADRRVGRQPAGGVGAAADRADDQVGDAHLAAGRILQLPQGLLDPRAAVADRRSRAAGLLDDQRLDRPAGAADDFRQAVAVETLAAQGDQQHRAHIGMRADPPQDAIGIRIRIAAGKADQMDALLARRAAQSRAPRDGHIRPGRRRPRSCGCLCGRRNAESLAR